MERKLLSKGQAIRGFVFSSVIFFAVFASTAVPIPLYSHYQAAIGLTNNDISFTMLLYLAGVVLTLLFASRVSDAFGRRRVTFLTLVLAVAGCVLFLFARTAFSILAARFVQGIAAGLTMSAVSALIVDSIARYRLGWGSAMASCGPMVGIMLGSIGSGVLFGATQSVAIVFGVTIAVLVLSAFGLIGVPDVLAVRASKRAVLHPSVLIPRNALGAFVVACSLYIATWVACSFFQAFSAPLVSAEFSSTSTLRAALVLSAAMAPSMIGGPLTSHLSRRPALYLGMGLFLASLVAMPLLLSAQLFWPFMGACALFSVAMGICTATALRMMLVMVDAAQTSAIIGSINLFAYVGSAAGSLVMGETVSAWGYAGTLWAIAAVGLAFCGVVLTAMALKRRKEKALRETRSSRPGTSLRNAPCRRGGTAKTR